MHQKDRRKLEILLELKKYLDKDIIVKSIDEEITSQTLVKVKKGTKTLSFCIGVSKNVIYLEPNEYISHDLANLVDICPQFVIPSSSEYAKIAHFLNQYINYFSEEVTFDIALELSNLQNSNIVEIKGNSFFSSITLNHEIKFTEGQIYYMIHVLLKSTQGFSQNIIISTDPKGNFNLAIGVDCQYVSQPINALTEQDYVKYFLFFYAFLFKYDEIEINHNSSFSDIKQALKLIEMLEY